MNKLGENDRKRDEPDVPDFNNRHPELRDGEMFFANIKLDEMNGDGWKRLVQDYKTLRVGDHAYSIRGELLPRHAPLFIQRNDKRRLSTLPDFERKFADWLVCCN